MKAKLLFFLFFSWVTVFSQEVPSFSYSINGRMDSDSSYQYIFIEYAVGAKKVKDSVLSSNGYFAFKGNVPEPVIASIYTKNTLRRSFELLLVNTVAQLKLSGNQWQLQQVNHPAILQAYKHLIQVDSIKTSYYGQYGTFTRNKDSVGLKRIAKIFDSLNIVDRSIAANFIRNHPSSPLLLIAFSRLALKQDDADSLERIWLDLPEWVKTSPSGLSIRERMNGSSGLEVGKKAPTFTQNDVNGQSYNLDTKHSKVILIDFWASWCAPCRKEHPALKEIYSSYQAKGFTIIAISLDTDKAAWLKAIQDDQIPWKQVSDLNGFNNPIALTYGIKSIPSNFLVNQQGEIIGKNIRPEVLRKMLTDLLD